MLHNNSETPFGSERDLTAEKENALTFEDFKKKEIVLLADEAHHMNVQTRSQQLELELEKQKPSWENTVENIFNANTNNLLLEFTATHDYENSNIVDKYRNKIIYRYDLVNFRNDRFSKDVVLVHSDLDPQSRILQALILNQYKEEVAANNGVNLKPVILFKAQRTIAQSQENKANFHKLIEGLTTDQIDKFRGSDIEIVQRAFRFFDKNNTPTAQLVQRLKSAFREDHCLSVNNESEKETYQLRLNNLEDRSNPIRAIFAGAETQRRVGCAEPLRYRPVLRSARLRKEQNRKNDDIRGTTYRARRTLFPLRLA